MKNKFTRRNKPLTETQGLSATFRSGLTPSGTIKNSITLDDALKLIEEKNIKIQYQSDFQKKRLTNLDNRRKVLFNLDKAQQANSRYKKSKVKLPSFSIQQKDVD